MFPQVHTFLVIVRYKLNYTNLSNRIKMNTLAFEALILQSVKNGPTLVADGAAGLVSVDRPFVGYLILTTKHKTSISQRLKY